MARRRSKSRHGDNHRGLLELARKRRWTAAEARAVLAAQAESGQPVAAFARRQGLAPWRLYDWQRRLRQDETSVAPRFLPVRIVPSGEAVAGSVDAASGIEIVLGNGRRVRVDATFDPAVLTRVLAVLEHGSC